MKFRFSLFYFLFAFLGCSSSNGDIDKPENNGGAEEGNIEVSGDKVIVTPLSYDQAFRNPMMGWRDVFSVGLDPIPANYPLPYGSVYKEYIPWDRIENVKTDGVEKVIAYSNHRWEKRISKSFHEYIFTGWEHRQSVIRTDLTAFVSHPI